MADAPNIVVMCVNAICKQLDIQVTVPSGIVIGENVMSSYSPKCTVCGSDMHVVGPAS